MWNGFCISDFWGKNCYSVIQKMWNVKLWNAYAFFLQIGKISYKSLIINQINNTILYTSTKTKNHCISHFTSERVLLYVIAFTLQLVKWSVNGEGYVVSSLLLLLLLLSLSSDGICLLFPTTTNCITTRYSIERNMGLCRSSFCSLRLMSLFNKTLQSENFVAQTQHNGKISRKKWLFYIVSAWFCTLVWACFKLKSGKEAV